MMELRMEDRTCRCCTRTFKVMEGDRNTFHCGVYCRGKDPVTDKAAWIKDHEKAIKEKTVKSGVVELGEVRHPSQNESSKKASTGSVLKLQTESATTKRSEEKNSPTLKRETAPAHAETITLTGRNETRPGKNTEEKTEDNTMSTNAPTTIEPKTRGLNVLETPDSEETQRLDYKAFYGELETEKQSSVRLLQESAESLISLGEGLLKARKDDEGEVIRKPMNHDVDTALKAFEGARNMLKTKLDFLKFGKDLVTERKSK